MEENKCLKDCSTYELIHELRERDDVIDVTVWLLDDIKCALKEEGYIPTKERICDVSNKLIGCDFTDWDYAWQTIYHAIADCDFGECDYEEQ